MRRLIRPVLVAFSLLAIAVLGVVFGLEMIVGRALEARLEAETGHRWAVAGKSRFSLTSPPGLVINQLTARTDLAAGAVVRVEIETVRLFGSVSDFLASERLSRVELERPVIQIPSEWWRYAPTSGRGEQSPPPGAAKGFHPDHVIVRDGLIRLTSGETAEAEIRRIELEALKPARTSQTTVKVSALIGDDLVRSAITFTPRNEKAKGFVPVQFTIDWPRFPDGSISGTADAALEGAVLTLSRLAGGAATSRFSGAVVADFQAKPFLRVDLGFPVLTIVDRPSASGRAPLETGQPRWMISPAFMTALRMFDGRLKAYAGTLEAAPVSLSELSGEVRLANGALALELSRVSLYGGEAQGNAMLSTSGSALRYTGTARASGVRSLPFLADTAGVTVLDGVASITLELSGIGWTREELTRTLAGNATVEVTEGRINKVDLPSLARLVVSQLSGQPQGAAEATIFDRISASFAVKDGRATTDNVDLRGPVVVATGSGSVHLGDGMLAFRMNPQLARGGGPASRLAGLGVPVLIEGHWKAPRVTADFGAVTLPKDGASGLDALGGLLGAGGSNGLGKLLEGIMPDSSSQRRTGPRR